MHIEEQAREKWCPFARLAMYVRGDMPDIERPVDLVGHGCNRICTDDPDLTKSIQAAIEGTGGTKCIASNCMVWRWVPLTITPEYLDAVRALAEATAEKAPFAKAARAVADKPEAHGLPSKPFRGFCGLAGKP